MIKEQIERAGADVIATNMKIALWIVLAVAFPLAYVFTVVGMLFVIDWFVRRVTRFSIRDLLIVMTVVAVILRLLVAFGKYLIPTA